MRTLNGDDIRRTDPYRHKFADAMSEYLYGLDHDDRDGDSTDYGLWFARVGRWIVWEQSTGAVGATKFETEDEARRFFTDESANYGRWLGDDEPEGD